MSGKAFIRVVGYWDEGYAALEAMAREPVSDRPAFLEIVQRMGAAVRAQFLSVAPPSPETAKRKAWGPIKRSTKGGSYHGSTGSMSGTMQSSGDSLRNFEERSTDVSAAVKAGKYEWYLWEHNLGKGYAYWTVDNRAPRTGRVNEAGRKRSHKGSHSTSGREANRGRERNAGTVTYPRREFMTIPAAIESWAVERISQAVEDSMMRNWDGPAV